ncbi:MAG: oligosaccharide flippase family protein [Ignavibacteria bacterium]|nr:oligosaccharide flippase family protein [Ignavibacteria bacterium]
MGIVEKQSVRNTILSYLGVIIGYVNVVLLFPAFFTTEQFGLVQLLISASVIYAQLSQVGIVNAITRFFPFFRTSDKKHNGFITIIISVLLSGFALTTLLYIVFKPLIVEAYKDNSSLFLDYYYFLIPLSMVTVFFNVLEALARAIFRTVFSTLMREVGIRIFTTIFILIYSLKLIDFNTFVYSYLISYFLCALLILIQLFISKEYYFYLNFSYIKKDKLIEILKYGGFTLLSSASLLIGTRVDGLILGSMINLSIVGVYFTFLYIATVINVPNRSLAKITVPIIANLWKEKNIKEINAIYKKTSLILLSIGMLIYIGIVVNEKNLLYMLRNKPEFIDNFIIFYLIGLAYVFDAAFSLSSEVISNSPNYKYDSLFNFILLVSSVLFNILFISLYGSIGAALAILVSYTLFNTLKLIFLKRKYNISILSLKHLIVLITGAFVYIIGISIPFMINLVVDILIRSIIISIIFLSIIYFLKISEDINSKIDQYLNLVLFFRKNVR